MHKKYRKYISIVLMLNITTSLYAVDIIPKKSKYYYDLGGGANIDLPPPSRYRSINLGGYAKGDLGYTCTGFNPSISLGNSLNNMSDSVQALKQDVVSSATSAAGSLPMYVLSKSNPEMYNLLQNAMAAATETFKLSMKDCETALSDIKQGKSVYEDWFSISDSQGWLDGFNGAKQKQKVDINKVAKNNTKEHRKKGIPWIHDGSRSGGEQQTPIKVIQDIVIAGYNATAKEDRFTTRKLDSDEPAKSDSELYKYWRRPSDAAAFAKYVLGDITISSDKSKQDDTAAGMGLVGILKTCPFKENNVFGSRSYNDLTCVETVRANLITIVQTNERPSKTALEEISAGSMVLTPDIIQSIRSMDESNKAITISKLSEDTAMQNLVEQSLMLRRLLIAGSQTKPVQNLEPALRAVYKTIEQLDQEMQNLSFESDIRRKFGSRTISAIMNETYNRQKSALSNQVTSKSLDMSQGAVYTKGGKSS